jgi:uncharacterized protein (DUF302 family)
MPCKIALYEDAGKTVISSMNMNMMLSAVKSNAELYQKATGIFESLKSLMASLSKI